MSRSQRRRRARPSAPRSVGEIAGRAEWARGAVVSVRAVAVLAFAVAAPAHDRAVGTMRAHVRVVAGELVDVGEIVGPVEHGPRIERAAVANLPVNVVAPAVDVA